MKSALIITADPEVRLRWLRHLGRHGWWVDVADTVERASAFLEASPWDLVLIDQKNEPKLVASLATAMKTHHFWRSPQ